MPEADLDTLIRSSESGDAKAREQLFSVLYAELHGLAQRQLRRNSSLTLSPTMLLHETYLSISNRGSKVFPDRARFLAYASRAMRGLIIDYFRSRAAQKRGGAFEITALPTEVPHSNESDAELKQLGEAVDSLARIEPRLAQVVDLKFFCGMTFGEIAAALGISDRTVKRDWEKARILLHHELTDS
ncbi:MAG TPA: ECF-type sigma factor [Steroidobacteraceae bacterium]|jgi:RNA polymerase sigma factor (TIGR02999 family)